MCRTGQGWVGMGLRVCEEGGQGVGVWGERGGGSYSRRVGSRTVLLSLDRIKPAVA